MWTQEQENGVYELIEREAQTGINAHGVFVDAHQGLSVIEEEADETKEEYKKMKASVKAMRKAVFEDNDDVAFDLAYSVYRYAKLTMLEAMQTAAMAMKYMVSFESEGK